MIITEETGLSISDVKQAVQTNVHFASQDIKSASQNIERQVKIARDRMKRLVEAKAKAAEEAKKKAAQQASAKARKLKTAKAKEYIKSVGGIHQAQGIDAYKEAIAAGLNEKAAKIIQKNAVRMSINGLGDSKEIYEKFRADIAKAKKVASNLATAEEIKVKVPGVIDVKVPTPKDVEQLLQSVNVIEKIRRGDLGPGRTFDVNKLANISHSISLAAKKGVLEYSKALDAIGKLAGVKDASKANPLLNILNGNINLKDAGARRRAFTALFTGADPQFLMANRTIIETAGGIALTAALADIGVPIPPDTSKKAVGSYIDIINGKKVSLGDYSGKEKLAIFAALTSTAANTDFLSPTTAANVNTVLNDLEKRNYLQKSKGKVEQIRSGFSVIGGATKPTGKTQPVESRPQPTGPDVQPTAPQVEPTTPTPQSISKPEQMPQPTAPQAQPETPTPESVLQSLVMQTQQQSLPETPVYSPAMKEKATQEKEAAEKKTFLEKLKAGDPATIAIAAGATIVPLAALAVITR